MDEVKLNRDADMSNDTHMDDSLPLVDSIESDIYGEQAMFPRIGEDYQVELPKLVKKSDYLSQEYYQTDGGHLSLRFLMGLPIPITLVQQYSEHLSEKVNGLMSAESSSRYERHTYSLVPGLAYRFLSGDEIGSFLLGLYIFLKNFIKMKRFLESKSMGEIQAYYYGKFYRTNEHSRWSERRKIRSRKCVVGQKLFTGVRQQEFLSRVLPVVSDECKHAVQEVSKIFEDQKMEFEEFIFSLKSLVGTSVLVEAVGIGKGKHDLTCIVLENNTKSSQGVFTRPEIPIGKECASLTCDEIVKYLTGDYRLSKARSNDLFWEAVWPRLLARGWHSEQPLDQGYVSGGKNNLVFLVPGIKKFSRWKLIRGSQYFDCVSDVLNKVASEPKLLDLDTEEKEENNKNEEDFDEEDDDVSTQSRHCYLQPQTPNYGTYGMKFTVVDTSLGGGKPYIITELRSLSVDLVNGVDSISPIEISYEDPPDASFDDNTYTEKDEIFYEETHCDSESVENSSKKRRRLTPCNAGETNYVGLETPKTVLQNVGENPVPEMAPRARTMIDLNLLPDSDTVFTVTAEETRDPNEKIDEVGCSNVSYISNDLNTQRRGTRNRPPTTRALEAFANGFLTVNSRGKGSSRSNSTSSRPSRRAQGGMNLSESQISDVGPSLQESQSNVSDGNTTEIREFRVLPEENVYQFLPPSL